MPALCINILSSGFNIQSHSLLLFVFLRYARFCERALLFQGRQFTKSVIKNVIFVLFVQYLSKFTCADIIMFILHICLFRSLHAG